MFVWSVTSPKLPLKNEHTHIFWIFLKMKNKTRILIFVLTGLWNPHFWILLFFFIVKLNFRICIKIISKSNIYFRSRLFFWPIAVEVGTRDFGLRKILWVIFILFYFFIDSFTQQQWIKCKSKKCVAFSPTKKLCFLKFLLEICLYVLLTDFL